MSATVPREPYVWKVAETTVDRHGCFRFGWELVGPDGTVVARGLDVAELAGDGRLQSVIGYVDELAQAA